jgi:cobyrinic acid a,c-diamide synthase
MRQLRIPGYWTGLPRLYRRIASTALQHHGRIQCMRIPAFMVVGTSSGAGKTTITRGIIASLRRRGLAIQSYKLGPDYIDAGHHSALTGRPCVNLDAFLLTAPGQEANFREALIDEFHGASHGADVLVVESAGGVFDDWHHDGTSPAGIARALDIPVLLVVDGFASCQTLGLTINALLDHDARLRIVGVVVTKLSSPEHYDRIVETVDSRHKQLLLGFIPGTRELFIEERHLGLLTSAEVSASGNSAETFIAQLFEQRLALDTLLATTVEVQPPRERGRSPAKTCCIAIARDKAFSFYYDYNLRRLGALGADIRTFSPLGDDTIPDDVDAIYLGGGFPEIYAEDLAKNSTLMRSLRNKVEHGLPLYAECGGLIYLANRVQVPATGELHAGVGVFPFDALFSSLLRLSYTVSTITSSCVVGDPGWEFKGHVFHRTVLSDSSTREMCAEIRGIGDSCEAAPTYAYRHRNVFASYVHAHFRSAEQIAARFVAAATCYRSVNNGHKR